MITAGPRDFAEPGSIVCNAVSKCKQNALEAVPKNSNMSLCNRSDRVLYITISDIARTCNQTQLVSELQFTRNTLNIPSTTFSFAGWGSLSSPADLPYPNTKLPFSHLFALPPTHRSCMSSARNLYGKFLDHGRMYDSWYAIFRPLCYQRLRRP